MTSLAVSLSIDARGPCALYIVTDSRITWERSAHRWDAGQKTFASRATPDIFGFCGDAFFPPAILRQAMEQLDLGFLGSNGMVAGERHTRIVEVLQRAIDRRLDAPMRAFSIFHGARDGESMQSRFCLWETQYSAAVNRWTDRKHNLVAENSYLAIVDGSGRNVVENTGREWIGSDAEGTSRAAIWAFCDALASGKDPFSGGAPQLVGLWRKGSGRTFGMVWEEKRFLSGLEVDGDAEWNKVDWFNSLFERCDGATGRRFEKAKQHVKPKKS